MGVNGEQHLWIAVVSKAIKDAFLCRGAIRDEAVHFLTGKSRWFYQVCEMAGLEADYIMDGVQRANKLRRVK